MASVGQKISGRENYLPRGCGHQIGKQDYPTIVTFPVLNDFQAVSHLTLRTTVWGRRELP